MVFTLEQWKSITTKYHHLLKWILFVQFGINGWLDGVEKTTFLSTYFNVIAVVAATAAANSIAIVVGISVATTAIEYWMCIPFVE